MHVMFLQVHLEYDGKTKEVQMLDLPSLFLNTPRGATLGKLVLAWHKSLHLFVLPYVYTNSRSFYCIRRFTTRWICISAYAWHEPLLSHPHKYNIQEVLPQCSQMMSGLQKPKSSGLRFEVVRLIFMLAGDIEKLLQITYGCIIHVKSMKDPDYPSNQPIYKLKPLGDRSTICLGYWYCSKYEI